MAGSLISSSVLVLNRSYQPLQLTTVRRALVQLYSGAALAVDRQLRTLDFEAWIGLAEDDPCDFIRTPRRKVPVPRVVLLAACDRLPGATVRLCRANLFARDGHRCQYCGVRPGPRGLNVDHVLPRSRGGGTHWENVVVSCLACNHRKGSRTPEEAGMKLIVRPIRPRWNPLLRATVPLRDEWRPFFGATSLNFPGEDARSTG